MEDLTQRDITMLRSLLRWGITADCPERLPKGFNVGTYLERLGKLGLLFTRYGVSNDLVQFTPRGEAIARLLAGGD